MFFFHGDWGKHYMGLEISYSNWDSKRIICDKKCPYCIKKIACDVRTYMSICVCPTVEGDSGNKQKNYRHRERLIKLSSPILEAMFLPITYSFNRMSAHKRVFCALLLFQPSCHWIYTLSGLFGPIATCSPSNKMNTKKKRDPTS